MLQDRPFFTLIAGFALVGALVVVAFLLIARQAESTGWVTHTLDVQNKLTALLSRLQDAETGQRGFLLTDTEEFLQPYESALAHINRDFTEVQQATADNPIQQSALGRLKPLIDRRMTLLGNLIESYRRGDRENALSQPLLAEGKSVMDQARTVFAEMSRTEAALLSQRQAAAIKEGIWTKIGLVALAATIIALAAIVL
jgi:CHASE3 domain sensor protein